LVHPLHQLRLQGFIQTGGVVEHLTCFAVVILSIILLVS